MTISTIPIQGWTQLVVYQNPMVTGFDLHSHIASGMANFSTILVVTTLFIFFNFVSKHETLAESDSIARSLIVHPLFLSAFGARDSIFELHGRAGHFTVSFTTTAAAELIPDESYQHGNECPGPSSHH
jgi:hypothetical protein